VRAARLRRGDTVAVVSPSGPVRGDRLDAGVAVLESWGLSVVLMDHVRGTHEHFAYLAADDEARADDFMRAWLDPDVTAVFAARGGYGAQRMVDLVDWVAVAAAAPKVFVGFSDITALHQAFASRVGLSTVLGPVVTSLGAGDDESRAHLRRLLFEPASGVVMRAEPLAPGVAEGVLVGGNLALLAAETGAGSTMTGAKSIAVFEDVSEDLYRLDRMVTHLLRSGWFDAVRGIVLGSFAECGPPDDVRALMVDRLGGLGVPMVWDAPVGHGARNLAVPLGVRARLDGDSGTLELRDAPLVGATR
jgi:muramoyltetrapeptide carboxypeptidase